MGTKSTPSQTGYFVVKKNWCEIFALKPSGKQKEF